MRPVHVPRELPYLDEHAISIAASRERVWAALERYAGASLRIPEGNPLARILGTEPSAGFEVVQRVPLKLLSLGGRHRYSAYLLTFELTAAADGSTHLVARSHAAFPGARGRAYRALVIGTGGHRAAVAHMLRSVRRLATG